jgi:hypothetical protein
MEPGQELDKLIAEKVMGWTDIIKSDVVHGKFTYRGKHPDPTHRGYLTSDQRTEIPEYSTKFSDAWEVVERLKINSKFTLTFGVGMYEKWYVAMGEKSLAYAGTAPHAICLAALNTLINNSNSPK